MVKFSILSSRATIIVNATCRRCDPGGKGRLLERAQLSVAFYQAASSHCAALRPLASSKVTLGFIGDVGLAAGGVDIADHWKSPVQ